MSPPKPEIGAHVRLFLRSKRKIDGVLVGDLGRWVWILRDHARFEELVVWEQVFSYHRLDERGHLLPQEPTLPLEVEG